MFIEISNSTVRAQEHVTYPIPRKYYFQLPSNKLKSGRNAITQKIITYTNIKTNKPNRKKQQSKVKRD